MRDIAKLSMNQATFLLDLHLAVKEGSLHSPE